MIKQESLILSPYIALYDIIIPKEHELRQLADLVDFSFVDDMLKGMYTLDNGRPGYRPQVMFKYLMLKRMYELSDRDETQTDCIYYRRGLSCYQNKGKYLFRVFGKGRAFGSVRLYYAGKVPGY